MFAGTYRLEFASSRLSMRSASTNAAALGFRSKTGRAVMLALGGPLEAPRLLLRREVALATPDVPATVLPYHQVMALPWEEAIAAVQATELVIAKMAAGIIHDVIVALGAQGHRVAVLGIAGAPDRDLARIGNRHIRSHAAEGILFRRVLELGAAGNDVRSCSFSDRTTEAEACTILSCSPQRLDQVLRDLGRAAGPPWRADERLAALSALLALRSIDDTGPAQR